MCREERYAVCGRGCVAGGSALFCWHAGLLPGLADGWMTAVFAPVSGALSGLSGRCSFAVAEPLALLLAALFVFFAVSLAARSLLVAQRRFGRI